jgi:hypothetical protein
VIEVCIVVSFLCAGAARLGGVVEVGIVVGTVVVRLDRMGELIVVR